MKYGKTELNEKQSQRWWVFTVNNYTDVDIEQLNVLCNDVDYLTYGFETGKENGTKHLQGYLEFPPSTTQRFSWLKKRVPRAYFAARRGSRTQARDYCFKECTEPFEHGVWRPDKQGMRNDLVSIKRKLDGGMPMVDVAEEHFGSFIRYNRGFYIYEAMQRKKRRKICKNFKCVWIVGPAGSGKTEYIYEKYGMDFYQKPNNKWWDAYDGEDVVVWDDYEKSSDYCYGTFLKWTDRYPKQGESKGGHRVLSYHTIVFTCTRPPSDHVWYDEQFRRRVDVVNITHVTSSQNI